MSSLNVCHLYGNLCADPELRTAGSSSVVRFRIAVNERYKKGEEWAEETSFFDVEAWGQKGELVHKFYKKGDGILLTCKAKQDQWEDKESGQKRSKVVFRVTDLVFTGRGGEGGEGGARQPQQAGRGGRPQSKGRPQPAPQAGGDDGGDGDPIPF